MKSIPCHMLILAIIILVFTGCYKKKEQPEQNVAEKAEPTQADNKVTTPEDSGKVVNTKANETQPNSQTVPDTKTTADKAGKPTATVIPVESGPQPPPGGWPVEAVYGLKIREAKMDDVLKKLGEPTKRTNTRLYYMTPEKEVRYLFIFNPFAGDSLNQVAIREPGFKLSTGVGIGSSQEELFAVYGKKDLRRPRKKKGRMVQSMAYYDHSKIYFELWQDEGSDKKYVGSIAVSDPNPPLK